MKPPVQRFEIKIEVTPDSAGIETRQGLEEFVQVIEVTPDSAGIETGSW